MLVCLAAAAGLGAAAATKPPANKAAANKAPANKPTADKAAADKPTAQVDMSFLDSGATAKLGAFKPLRLHITKPKPKGLTAVPDMSSPLYGQLTFGGKTYALAVDESSKDESKLYVDQNGNGDLTDDAPVAWEKKTATADDGTELQQYGGKFKLPLTLRAGETPVEASIGVYRFDPNDPKRKDLKFTLLYYADYAYEGEVSLAGQSYRAMLADDNADGKFGVKSQSATRFLIDVNGDGKFAPRGEVFDFSRPFNIKGTTWDASPADSGPAPVAIVKSSRSAPEVAPPPNHAVGQAITPFKAKRMDGKTVSFPEDYKGKIVLLDFWATWCGPCMNEVPGLVQAYNTYHPQGMEVLGISLDEANAGREIKSVTSEHGMTWPQVHDGKGWKAAVAVLYDIHSIPSTYLVDGDTGKVLAVGGYLRGDYLPRTIEAELKKKASAPAAASAGKPATPSKTPEPAAEDTGL